MVEITRNATKLSRRTHEELKKAIKSRARAFLL